MRKQYRTGDQNWVRERNLAIVLSYLWEAGREISRADLAELSGLNKSTVGNLLVQLQVWGLVKESGVSSDHLGRPGVLLDINADAGRIIGIELGVGFVSAVVADMKANVIWRRKVEMTDEGRPLAEASQEQVLEQSERLVQEAIEYSKQCTCRLFGLGVGLPGLVDHRTGTLLFAPNLGWHNVPIRDMWRTRFGTLVIEENEADAAALGEHMLGVAKQVDNFVYLSAGVGLGGGLVIDGKLRGGARGFAGEIGHMTLEPDGPVCNCGNRGCWETLIGPRAILQSVRQAARENRAPILLSLCNGDPAAIQIEQVLQAAARGEPAVLIALAEVGRYLGIGIANLINALDPNLIVLGGVLSAMGSYILPRAQYEVNLRALPTTRESVEIKLSAFQLDACLMGGVALILHQVLGNPAIFYPKPTGQAFFEEGAPFTTGIL
ncbi:MAG: ROK family transcriptional regulator [Anaerolineae bacterium]